MGKKIIIQEFDDEEIKKENRAPESCILECAFCHGEGKRGMMGGCKVCNGNGKAKFPGSESDYIECKECNGEGHPAYTGLTPCSKCHGWGKVRLA
jgi:DnaJ-class molecular chaperone